MAAFLGISLWIALVTVVPGLVTIAALYGALAATGMAGPEAHLSLAGEWVPAAIAITVMILTQALGILLERVLFNHRWLGPAQRAVTIPPGIDPDGAVEFTLAPYDEYKGLFYLLLAELRDDEDAYGHLQRALAQFSLSNNTLVSFTAGIFATLLALWLVPTANVSGGLIYAGALAVCLLVSFQVAKIRFEVMAKALWAERRRRLSTP